MFVPASTGPCKVVPVQPNEVVNGEVAWATDVAHLLEKEPEDLTPADMV